MNKSAVLNWYHDRIKIFPVALGDAEGKAALSYYPNRLGDAQIDADEKAAEPFCSTGAHLVEKKEITVSVRKLDTIIPVELPIKLMKIDAEGHESKILKGCAHLLSKKAFDFIMLEAEIELATSLWKDTLKSLTMLSQLGYKAGSIDSDGFLIKHSSLEEALASRSGKTLVFSAT